uniref:Uncharacterized protein n=1 Tax=Ananas comosus var. bracteatus TaxID=296719 RepID=A0A6V7Q8E7_ANACO|nr:unnamed protein product [Ananas comosus var. bracteatus]
MSGTKCCVVRTGAGGRAEEGACGSGARKRAGARAPGSGRPQGAAGAGAGVRGRERVSGAVARSGQQVRARPGASRIGGVGDHRGVPGGWRRAGKSSKIWRNSEPYKPGYTAPPRANPDDTAIDISGGWTVNGTLDLHDPRILAMAAAQHQCLEAEYDDYAATNASGAAFCRSAALI